MPTRLYRIQSDAIDGVLQSLTIFDEVVSQDPVTDEMVGTGNLLPPTVITAASDPELFALLNARGTKTTERVQAHRAKLADAKREAAAELSVEPKES